MVKTKEDLTGKKFGHLTVIEQAEDHVTAGGNVSAAWLCECDCENKTKRVVVGAQLKNGSCKSCGCTINKAAVDLIGKRLLSQHGRYYTPVDSYVDKHGNRQFRVVFDSGHEAYYNSHRVLHGKVIDKYEYTIVEGVGRYMPGLEENRDYEFSFWRTMINRCYSEDFAKRFPTYERCTVCDRWLTYKNFKDDFSKICNYKESMSNNHRGRLTLDKDILYYNNPIYSLETCCLVPEPVNIFITNKKSNNKSGLIGVHKRNNRNYEVSFTFKNKMVSTTPQETPEAAVREYYSKKRECLHELLDEYDWLNKAVVDGINNYLDTQEKEQIEKAKTVVI